MMIIIREQPAEGSKQKAGHLALVMLFVVAAGTLRRLAAHQRRRVMSSTRLPPLRSLHHQPPPHWKLPTYSRASTSIPLAKPFPSAGMSCRLPAQIDFVCVFLTPAAIRIPNPAHNHPRFFASKII